MPSSAEFRRIGSKIHNNFVANGVEEHKPTTMVPASFLHPLADDMIQGLQEKHSLVEDTLNQAIGKPYFSESGFILYHGDSVELLGRLSDHEIQIDLTITSPPYNIGKEYEETTSVEEYIEWCEKWMRQIYELTRNSGTFCLNVGYLEVPGRGLCVPIPYLLWNKSKFYLLQEVVWHYGAGVSSKRRLSPRNEKWLLYVKTPKDYTFNLDAIRDPNVKYPNQKRNGNFRCNPLGKNPSDVWTFPKITTGNNRSSRERTGHPAQFPLGIVERLVKAFSNDGEIIIDPFSGSASAGIAAIAFGRLFIGIEKKLEYCRLAVERFKAFKREKQLAQSQKTLF